MSPHENCTCCRHWRVVEQLSSLYRGPARTDEEKLAAPIALLQARPVPTDGAGARFGS